MPELKGKCKFCGTPVTVLELPANVVFFVDDKVVHDCPKCGETLLYMDVMEQETNDEPAK